MASTCDSAPYFAHVLAYVDTPDVRTNARARARKTHTCARAHRHTHAHARARTHTHTRVRVCVYTHTRTNYKPTLACAALQAALWEGQCLSWQALSQYVTVPQREHSFSLTTPRSHFRPHCAQARRTFLIRFSFEHMLLPSPFASGTLVLMCPGRTMLSEGVELPLSAAGVGGFSGRTLSTAPDPVPDVISAWTRSSACTTLAKGSTVVVADPDVEASAD
jgi:hypothetical protein